MCGIAGIFGNGWERRDLERMVAAQRRRGPDAEGVHIDPAGAAALGHNRLSIIDLSPAGAQPMASAGGRYWIAFNGEIYNYLELRRELTDYPFRGGSDTEVLLAAFERWGETCLDRLTGMFAFLIWDSQEQLLFAARDRFGVKPLYYHSGPNGRLLLASEVKALHAAGVTREADAETWSTWLAHGLYDHSDRTFWRGIRAVPAGHFLKWRNGEPEIERWYDLAARTGAGADGRSDAEVEEEYSDLLKRSVALRFRSDVPVGINLSGGLDSSLLLGLVQAVQGPESAVEAFTFVTGHPDYDELPWVRRMLERTRHPSRVCALAAEEVPELARSVQEYQDEPFGGLPTLAYARLFEVARQSGSIVLLDGQGLDEQWAGYDYYARALNGRAAGLVQGVSGNPLLPDCLVPEFRAAAEAIHEPRPFADPLRNLQFRDIRLTKIPRALRFNDRVSMRSSTELREPFLDHRLVELALRQPAERKLRDGVHKWMLRRIAARLAPASVVEAPKRPLQTPQREWLRGPLREWACSRIALALDRFGGIWLNPAAVNNAWQAYCEGQGDNSFPMWQWISLGLMAETHGLAA